MTSLRERCLTADATFAARRPFPRRTPRFAALPSRHVVSCMLMVAASVSRCRLLRDSSCSSACDSSWFDGHVLAPPEQLAGGDLVEDGRHLVVAQQPVQDVVLERLHRGLEPTVIAARQGDLVAAPSSRPSRRSRSWRIGVRASGGRRPSSGPASSSAAAAAAPSTGRPRPSRRRCSGPESRVGRTPSGWDRVS